MATVDKTNVDLAPGGGSPHSTAAHGGESEIRSSTSSENEIVGVPDRRRESSASECSVEVVDLEAGDPQIELHLAKHKRDCRICHLSMDATNQESGVPMELGCSCKDDLAAAHKQCAEAWFKIKGNK